MKKLGTILVFLYSLNLFAHPALHLDLEMGTEEYQALLKEPVHNGMRAPLESEITFAIKLGERLNKWIEIINFKRKPDQLIRLTSTNTRKNYPIHKPNTYSVQIIGNQTKQNINKLPAEMASALLSSDELPHDILIDDSIFIKMARSIDYTYQLAVRYKMLIPYKEDFIEAAHKDIRGYYYLKESNIDASYLRDLNSIEESKLPSIEDALISLCRNDINNSKGICIDEVSRALVSNTLSEVYLKYFPIAQSIWNQFFEIAPQNIRNDIYWGQRHTMIPFKKPVRDEHSLFLKHNVEDEFKWGDWRLLIKFNHSNEAPTLKFKAGVTPHVAKANIIIMDSNQSIEEFDTKWTVRHEFGHILGLPDCYHEFYDEETKSFISYQLDVTDLMCSRTGSMNERIYKELKKAYKR